MSKNSLRAVCLAIAVAVSSSRESVPKPFQPCAISAADLKTKTSFQSGMPMLSWMVESTTSFESENNFAAQRNLSQSAYQIIVCTNGNGCTTPVWDSGKVVSNETLNINYGGSALKSGQQLYWTVKIWDQNEAECAKVASGEFEIGLLQDSDWSGNWITKKYNDPLPVTDCELFNSTVPTPLFRATFDLANEANEEAVNVELVRARVFISGLGYYRLWINGERVGTSELDPGFTTYGDRVLYATYNVTEMLRSQSAAVVGVELGNGWWNPLPLLFWGSRNVRTNVDVGQPMFIMEMRLEYSNGKEETFVSNDKDWTAGNSSTFFNNIYLGEKYDARMDQPGWNAAGFDDSKWGRVETVQSPSIGPLQSQEAPPVRKQEELTTTVVSKTPMGNFTVVVLDSGKNHAGTCQFHMKGAAGDTVTFRYGELLKANGELNPMTSVAGQIKGPNSKSPCQPSIAYQADTFILSGNAAGDTWSPAWSWHGMRYIEATLPAGVSMASQVTCHPMRSDMDDVATFASSDPSLAQIRTLNRNTVNSNLFSIQSDCPHRERFGYSGDALGTHEPIMQMMDMELFYRKRVFDMVDAQRANGGYTETSPFVGISDAGLGDESGPIGWETYTVVQVWDLYKYYGDVDILEASFDSIYNYTQLLDTKPAGIENGLGDWMPVRHTSTVFSGLSFWLQSYQNFIKICGVLGKSDLVTEYEAKASDVKSQINQMFLNNKTGLYSAGGANQSTQTGQGFAIQLGIVPDTLKAKAVQVAADNANAASNIKGGGQGPTVGGPGPHMTAGLAGIQPFLMSLADGGENDLAHKVVTTPSYPSYMWMMNNDFDNATTIWESWFFSDNTYSHNHPMFCGAETWMMQTVLGIRPGEDCKGMSTVLIKPQPIKVLTFAKGSYKTVRGTVHVSWATDTTGFAMSLNVTVPPNVKADIVFPPSATSITELGGLDVAEHASPTITTPTTTSVPSGNYYFNFRI